MSAITLTPKEKIVRARIKFIQNNPLIAVLSLNLKLTETTELPTMAVDPEGHLFYNPSFVERLSSDEVVGVVAHEVLHVLLEHLLRKGHRDNDAWNVACDFICNYIVERVFQYKLPEGCLTEAVYNNSQLKKLVGKELAKAIPEEIYEKLQGQGGGQGKQGKGGCGTGSLTGELNKKRFDDHIYKKLTPEEEKKLKEYWDKKIREAVNRAREQGKMPGYFEGMFEFLEPKLDWRQILQNFIVQEMPVDWTWVRPNKKSEMIDVYLPSAKKERLKLVVCIDTSGSITDDEFNQFASEVKGIVQAYEEHIDMVIIPADTEPKKIYDNFDEFAEEMKRRGYGGTDFRPAIKLAQDEYYDKSLIIYFTDGHGDYPDEIPEMPVLWILTKDDHREPPFGESVVLDD